MFLIIVRGLAGSWRMRRGIRGDWTQCWWQRCKLCIHGVFTRREGEEQSEKKGEKKGWIAITKRCLWSFFVPISHLDRKIGVKWFETSFFQFFFGWSVSVNWCWYESGLLFILSVSLCLLFLCWIFAGMCIPSFCERKLQHCRCVKISPSLWPQCVYIFRCFNYHPHRICVIFPYCSCKITDIFLFSTMRKRWTWCLPAAFRSYINMPLLNVSSAAVCPFCL